MGILVLYSSASLALVRSHRGQAIMWHVWLTRNDCIFNVVTLSPHYVILKIAHVLIMWFSATPSSHQAGFDELVATIRRSLAFSGQHDVPTSGATHGGGDSV